MDVEAILKRLDEQAALIASLTARVELLEKVSQLPPSLIPTPRRLNSSFKRGASVDEPNIEISRSYHSSSELNKLSSISSPPNTNDQCPSSSSAFAGVVRNVIRRSLKGDNRIDTRGGRGSFGNSSQGQGPVQGVQNIDKTITLRDTVINYPPPSNFIPSREDCQLPPYTLELQYIYGYQGKKSRANLFDLSSGEAAYFVANVVVLFNYDNNSQRFYREHDAEIKCMSVHHNEPIIATGQITNNNNNNNGIIRIWRFDNLQTIYVINDRCLVHCVLFVAFSSAHPTYLASLDDGVQKTITVWDWENGNKITEAKASVDVVYAFNFNGRTRQLIITSAQQINFWQLKDIEDESTKIVKTLMVKKAGLFQGIKRAKAILCCCFNESSGETVTGDSEGNIIVWSILMSTVEATNIIHQAHQEAVTSLISTIHGFASGSRDGHVKIWSWDYTPFPIGLGESNDINIGENIRCLSSIMTNDGPSLSQLLVSTSYNRIFSIDALCSSIITIMNAHHGDIFGLSESINNEIFYTTSDDNFIMAWNSSTKQLIWRSKIPFDQESRCVNEHKTQDIIGVGTNIGNVELFSKNGIHNQTINVSSRSITCLCFSTDGMKLSIGSNDGIIHIYHGITFALINQLKGHISSIRHIDWSIDSIYLQSSSDDLELLFWNTVTMNREVHTSITRDIVWSTQTITVGWAVRGIHPRQQTELHLVNSLSRSPDNKLIVVGSDNVHLYKYPCHVEHSERRTFKGHVSQAAAVRFINNDTIISTGGSDHSIFQWKVVQTTTAAATTSSPTPRNETRSPSIPVSTTTTTFNTNERVSSPLIASRFNSHDEYAPSSPLSKSMTKPINDYDDVGLLSFQSGNTVNNDLPKATMIDNPQVDHDVSSSAIPIKSDSQPISCIASPTSSSSYLATEPFPIDEITSEI